VRRPHAMHILGALLAGIALLAAAALATAPQSVRPPRDTLAIGLAAEPKSLDPHATTALNDFRVLVNVYEGLVRFAAGSLDVEPALARRWQVSGDGLEYRFELRRDVRFHDGTPFDARAVRFNLERMLREDHPYHHTGPFPLAFFLDAVEEVRVLDTHHVLLRLREPHAPLLSNLAYPIGLMVSPAAVRRFGAEVGRHPAGTGPFVFAGWEGGRRVVLERNEDYRGAAPRSRRLVFRPVVDAMTRVAELRSGGLDVVPEVSPDNVTWFRTAPGFRVEEQVGPHLWFLILNTRDPPFDDVRMRRAANLAVDKRALVERVLQHTATIAAGPVPAAFRWALTEQVAPWPHDPVRARALVEAAGYAQGVDVVLLAPRGGSGMLAPVEMATAIQADLAAVGIRARIETFEWNAYLERVNAGLEPGVHLAAMAWMTNDPDTLPYLALRSGAHPPAGFNSGWYANPELDRLLAQARRATARAERARLYTRVQRIVHRDAPWLFVASWKQNAVANARVRALRLEPSFFLHLARVHKGPAP